MQNITFIGGGSFGTSLSILLANKGFNITIWDRNPMVVEEINAHKTNNRYLPNIVIPDGVIATNKMDDSMKESDYIILAVPSYAIRDMCKAISKYLNEYQVIVSIAKGIEEKSKMRLSKVIKEELPLNPVVILSGPSHAEEVSRNLPTTVVVSSENMEYAYRVQSLFMTNTFRIYTNDDIIGVEIGGAVKNIIALACGICDGLGYGDNTKAALMTRGMSEIVRVGTLLGGRRETFYGLTGMGDLIVTCTSLHSRNRRAGILIGEGVPMKEACQKIGMVVEGIKACEAFYELKDRLGVDMPITDMLYKVLFEDKDVKLAVKELMERDKKPEMH